MLYNLILLEDNSKSIWGKRELCPTFLHALYNLSLCLFFVITLQKMGTEISVTVSGALATEG